MRLDEITSLGTKDPVAFPGFDVAIDESDIDFAVVGDEFAVLRRSPRMKTGVAHGFGIFVDQQKDFGGTSDAAHIYSLGPGRFSVSETPVFIYLRIHRKVDSLRSADASGAGAAVYVVDFSVIGVEPSVPSLTGDVFEHGAAFRMESIAPTIPGGRIILFRRRLAAPHPVFREVSIDVSGPRQKGAVVVGVDYHAQGDLPHVVFADRRLRRVLGLAQCREQHAGQYGDNGDDH